MSTACRNRRGTKRAEGELGAALFCGQKLLFPYKAPLSRTILLEWLRKMPNRELGIAMSSAVVSSDRGKNSATLGLAASAPPPFSAAVRLCGEIVVALSSRVHVLFTSSAIVVVVVAFPSRSGTREYFSSRVSEYMANVWEKENTSWR